MIKLHSLKPSKGSKSHSRRVGRGHGSGRGKTAGRGTKGQKARTGGRKGLRLKGMKFITARLPKLRGFKSRYGKSEVVPLRTLEKAFRGGGIVTPTELAKRNVIASATTPVKIVGSGDLKLKFTVKGCRVSAGAKSAIEKAGGSIA